MQIDNNNYTWQPDYGDYPTTCTGQYGWFSVHRDHR